MTLNQNINSLEKKIISKVNRFEILKKDFRELQLIFKDKNILIIGAAGSIGYQFTKDLLKNFPVFKNLYLIDKNENELTDINRNLFLKYHKKKISYICSDIVNLDLDQLISKKKIHILLNFSAIKHVRSEENYYSSRYMFLTNSIYFLPKKKHTLQKAFSVSTDKTVDPKSILGVSKNLMEKNLTNFGKKNKIFVSTTRFANVSFSNGSILKYVYERLNEKRIFGIPEKIRRYFITHEEASALCMKALLKRYSNQILIPNPKILGKDLIIKELTEKIAFSLKKKIKFIKNKKNSDIKNKIIDVILTKPNTHGQKINEQLFSFDEKIYFDKNDKSIIYTKMPKFDNSLKNYLNKLLSKKNLKDLKKVIKQKYKNFKIISKVISVSKTI